jgi:hypothetical protein
MVYTPNFWWNWCFLTIAFNTWSTLSKPPYSYVCCSITVSVYILKLSCRLKSKTPDYPKPYVWVHQNESSTNKNYPIPSKTAWFFRTPPKKKVNQSTIDYREWFNGSRSPPCYQPKALDLTALRERRAAHVFGQPQRGLRQKAGRAILVPVPAAARLATKQPEWICNGVILLGIGILQ